MSERDIMVGDALRWSNFLRGNNVMTCPLLWGVPQLLTGGHPSSLDAQPVHEGIRYIYSLAHLAVIAKDLHNNLEPDSLRAFFHRGINGGIWGGIGVYSHSIPIPFPPTGIEPE